MASGSEETACVQVLKHPFYNSWWKGPGGCRDKQKCSMLWKSPQACFEDLGAVLDRPTWFK